MAAAVIFGSTQPMNEKKEKPKKQNLYERQDTIYVWYTDEEMSYFLNSAAVAFGEKEDMHVIPVLVSKEQYIESINEASLSKDQMPDVYLIGHDSLEKAYLAGLATECIDENQVLTAENFPASALASVTYRGKKVGYPLSYDTSVLVYNKTYTDLWAQQNALREISGDGEDEEEVLEEGAEAEEKPVYDESTLPERTAFYQSLAIPATVTDILNFADNFDVPDTVEGIMKWDVSDIFYNYWFIGKYLVAGGENGDDSNNISTGDPNVLACLEEYAELNQFFSIEADTVTYESVVQDFLAGKIVFTIATTDILNTLEQATKDGSFSYEYGVAMMPNVTDELFGRSMSVTNAAVVNGYSDKQQVADRFCAYLTTDCADMLYERSGKTSANLHANTDNAALQTMMAEYAESIPMPKMMQTSNMWLLVERVFSRAWKGEDVTSLLQELEIMLSDQI